MKILKFGGSSVGSPERIKIVAEIVKSAGKDVAGVVVSAFEGITNSLIETAKKAATRDASFREDIRVLGERHFSAVASLLPPAEQSSASLTVTLLLRELEELLEGVFRVRELSPRTLNQAMAFGERFSAAIVTRALTAAGLPSEMLDARELILTDENFGNAAVNYEKTYQQIVGYFSKHSLLQIITGFIASTADGETTTLGRGGSDFTASLFGAALKVDEVEIWTDVDGIMTADPRKVPDAFSLKSLSFEEAMELSHFGAKVIYPPTMQPARNRNIPIRVRNTFHPEFPGTIITSQSSDNTLPITGISSIPRISLVRLQGSGMIGVAGISGRLFSALAQRKISVILISQASSEHSICFAVLPDGAMFAKRAIEEEFQTELAHHLIDEVVVEEGLAIVSVVGENMRRRPGISGTLFSALGRNGVNIVAIAQGSSELNISVVMPAVDEMKALNVLHQRFFLSGKTTVHVFLAGTGLIANALLEQIEKQSAYLLKNRGLDVQLAGVTNRAKMCFSEQGLSLKNFKTQLANGEKAELATFLKRMRELNLPNAVFVDCTASDEVASYYREILDASISVVTPNKRAQSDKQEVFDSLMSTAQKRGVGFFFEASVGAGLPVIGTLQDLIASGDSIEEIEAILSGTISYIFNSFDGARPFSEIVREAKEKGLTEPDPRDDLSGKDVQRKLLILARVLGLAIESNDVMLEPVIPARLFGSGDMEKFWSELMQEDGDFEAKRRADSEQGKKLRYIASIKNGKAQVSLRSVGAEHPFYGLSGSDNVIVFRSERYSQRPLVVQGPGAGANVTAAAVFADVLRASSLSGARL